VNSVIFRTTSRWLLPVMLVVSIILLMRGHNEPGGGFVGGLMAAAAFSLYALAQGMKAVRTIMPVRPAVFIAAGLGTSLFSGVISILGGAHFMDSVWVSFPVAGFPEHIKVGTPVLFDVGVYLAVMGVVLLMIFSLEEYRDDPAVRD